MRGGRRAVAPVDEPPPLLRRRRRTPVSGWPRRASRQGVGALTRGSASWAPVWNGAGGGGGEERQRPCHPRRGARADAAGWRGAAPSGRLSGGCHAHGRASWASTAFMRPWSWPPAAAAVAAAVSAVVAAAAASREAVAGRGARDWAGRGGCVRRQAHALPSALCHDPPPSPYLPASRRRMRARRATTAPAAAASYGTVAAAGTHPPPSAHGPSVPRCSGPHRDGPRRRRRRRWRRWRRRRW